MMKWDLNCDLGEGETSNHTRGLMRWITSANVACGGHAGHERMMRRCVRLAQEFPVRLGAHPGVVEPETMGRAPVTITASELTALLLEQVPRVQAIAANRSTPLHHIKLHGGLYHAVEQSEELARAYLSCVQSNWPETKVYAFAGGGVSQLAGEFKVEVWGEAFIDRGYLDDGKLIPRGEEGALIEDEAIIADRIREFCLGSRVRARSGNFIPIQARTFCVHSDTPTSTVMAKNARRILDELGKDIEA